MVGKPVTAPRPMEGKSREDRCHGVVGMASDTTGRIKRQYDVRSKFPYPQDEIRDHALHLKAVKLSVWIVQNNGA